MNLRPYQTAAVDDAAEKLATARPGDRWLYSSPPGSGKSVVELTLQERVPGSWLVTPRVEIMEGMLQKRGHDTRRLSSSDIVEAAYGLRITTPIRLRNALARGTVDPLPRVLIVDEGHHFLAETYQLLEVYAPCPVVAFTATPYRGTPRETVKFLDLFREHIPIMTFPESVDMGVCSSPSLVVWPLVDDDEITVANGEFETRAANAAITSRLADVVERSIAYADLASGLWNRPTMFSFPSVETASLAAERLNAARPGLASLVTGDTPPETRRAAFTDAIARRTAIVQVYVVSEGVDLPIRRLIDCAPSLSPVKWWQQVGRITRPIDRGEQSPEYICTNRNLQRHLYLLAGIVPDRAVRDVQDAFGGLGQRTSHRAVGLEAVGRLKGTEVLARSGLRYTFYAFAAVQGDTLREYAAIVHPVEPTPFWASRQSGAKDDGSRAWGKWERSDPPNDVRGFASLPPSPVSEKQLAWWKRSANGRGLDGAIVPTRKQFQILPVLMDTRTTLR